MTFEDIPPVPLYLKNSDLVSKWRDKVESYILSNGEEGKTEVTVYEFEQDLYPFVEQIETSVM